ncbi:hypothetical protein F6V30_09045 [Oryzomonas sagensis]|uniref:Uncharacterized protein n=1 Tax=Oryzomonas sagensis TaxID=2603857 RepID=A0ABQ6TNS0_9BACT|nr:hypothetical protein [Oryzomonas sagensis]KAB0670291.1 hypothetical protein F6V30_09045 [Oryzomonas sagensis]
MHVVAICHWREGADELVQALAAALGITAYEARPRMLGGGPAVVASFADPQRAFALAGKLERSGFATLVFDATEVRGRGGRFVVRRFEFRKWALRIESGDGQQAEILYDDVDLLLPCTSVVGFTETKTVTERKLSLGKTLLAGGVPMTTKVERQEVVSTEERSKSLHLYAGTRSPAVFSQSGMTFDGLGDAMKMSRELNFAHLTSELRRLCPKAAYDDRLLTPAGQARLLGPGLNAETNLNLAVEILARSLRERGCVG